jgi:hypothetical protein
MSTFPGAEPKPCCSPYLKTPHEQAQKPKQASKGQALWALAHEIEIMNVCDEINGNVESSKWGAWFYFAQICISMLQEHAHVLKVFSRLKFLDKII